MLQEILKAHERPQELQPDRSTFKSWFYHLSWDHEQATDPLCVSITSYVKMGMTTIPGLLSYSAG